MFNFLKKKTKPKETQEKKLGYPTDPVLGQKGFVNEKVCDADIKKYKLQEVRPIEQWRLDENLTYYQWTIDREREIWLMFQKNEKSGLTGDPRDPEYLTGNKIYVLHYKGENIEVVLRDVYEEGSQKIENNQFLIVWDFIRMKKPESLKSVPDEEIITILKEVLSVYGSEKINTSVPQDIITVQFKF